MHSPDHSTKGTPSALSRGKREWPLTASEDGVSGSVSSPSRGAFHLSLTVLVHYWSLKVFSLGEWSPQLPTRFHVPRGTQDPSARCPRSRYGTLTRSGGAFQPLRVLGPLVRAGPTTPGPPERGPGLGCSRFARHYYGNLMLISCRRATEMFQFTHCPPSLPMCSAGGLQTSLWRGCPIRILRAHRLHAAPPKRFAGLRVLLRPSVPRHPPRPLCSLFSFHGRRRGSCGATLQ
jgi:hypothetical protein